MSSGSILTALAVSRTALWTVARPAPGLGQRAGHPANPQRGQTRKNPLGKEPHWEGGPELTCLNRSGASEHSLQCGLPSVSKRGVVRFGSFGLV